MTFNRWVQKTLLKRCLAPICFWPLSGNIGCFFLEKNGTNLFLRPPLTAVVNRGRKTNESKKASGHNKVCCIEKWVQVLLGH
jgi:hypothetical protein